jgi:hypothetical protein
MSGFRRAYANALTIAAALALGGCGGSGEDSRRAPERATPVAEPPLSEFASLTRTEAEALAVKACTTGQFASTVGPSNPLDACADDIYHQATDVCFHEADSSPYVPDDLVRDRCAFMERQLRYWAGEGAQAEQYRGGTDGGSPTPEPPEPPLADVRPEQWRGFSDRERADALAAVQDRLGSNCDEAPAAIAGRVDAWYEVYGEDRNVGGVLADICTGAAG